MKHPSPAARPEPGILPQAFRTPARRALAALLLLAITACGSNAAGTDAAAADAEAAARTWLAAADAGQGAATWNLAAADFQRRITAEQWQQALAAARAPLGTLRTRSSISARHAASLPGAPDGDYLVMQFQSGFEHKASAVETLTLARQSDGSWRVAGYFIR